MKILFITIVYMAIIINHNLLKWHLLFLVVTLYQIHIRYHVPISLKLSCSHPFLYAYICSLSLSLSYIAWNSPSTTGTTNRSFKLLLFFLSLYYLDNLISITCNANNYMCSYMFNTSKYMIITCIN